MEVLKTWGAFMDSGNQLCTQDLVEKAAREYLWEGNGDRPWQRGYRSAIRTLMTEMGLRQAFSTALSRARAAGAIPEPGNTQGDMSGQILDGLSTRARNVLHAEGLYRDADVLEFLGNEGVKGLAVLPRCGSLTLTEICKAYGVAPPEPKAPRRRRKSGSSGKRPMRKLEAPAPDRMALSSHI